MAGLDQEALRLSALLEHRGFVRRDRSGRALFASDAPRRAPEAWTMLQARLAENSCTLRLDKGLALISWTFEKSLAFTQALSVPMGWENGEDSLCGFCRILARHQARFEPGMLPHFLALLLLWDAGKGEALRRQAEISLATSLREGLPLPAYLLPLLLTLPERRPPC